MIEFRPIEKQVFDAAETMQYLGLSARSALDNLVSSGRLTPLKITKENRYARSELDDFIARELAKEQRLRGVAIQENENNTQDS